MQADFGEAGFGCQLLLDDAVAADFDLGVLSWDDDFPLVDRRVRRLEGQGVAAWSFVDFPHPAQCHHGLLGCFLLIAGQQRIALFAVVDDAGVRKALDDRVNHGAVAHGQRQKNPAFGKDLNVHSDFGFSSVFAD